MKPGKAEMVRTGLILLFALAAVPAYCQRGTIGVDVGQVRDQFAAPPSTSTALVNVNGEFTVFKPSQKKGTPAVVAGGELRFPTDTTSHAKEYAVYGGVVFGKNNFSVGVDGQVRKIYLPAAFVDNQFFTRYRMELFQLPVILKYKFGAEKRLFVEARGEPEFTPRFRSAGATQLALPSPNFDHGYTLRGTVGYTVNHWYAKAYYETRYFKFAENPNNPSNLYNWKSNVAAGSVGFVF